MARLHRWGRWARWAATVAVIFCFVSTQGNAALFASDGASSEGASVSQGSRPAISISDDLDAAVSPHLTLPYTTLDLAPAAPAYGFGGQIYRGRPSRTRNNDGSIAAMIIGSVAAITGAALLFYANRPECGVEPRAG